MSDAGVGEKALEVVLGEGAEITDEQGGSCDDGEDECDFFGDGRGAEEGLDDSHGEEETGGFGGDGEESGDGGGRAGVDIRDPDVEWHGADLESEADEDEQECEEDGGFRVLERGEFGCDAGEVGVSGDPVDPGHSIDEESGAESAEDEVFHAGFEGFALAAEVCDEHVEGDGDEFEGDECEDEIGR